MKIYTKTGDEGNTKLIGGRSARKDDQRLHAYGSIDELNAFLGLAISTLSEDDKQYSDIISELTDIQHELFDAGSDLADPDNKIELRITENKVSHLEKRIDAYNDDLPKVEKFVLPGGSQAASLLHICRTITRRAERHVVSVMEDRTVPHATYKYINRLSDYFFTLARYVNYLERNRETFYERGGKVFHHEE